MKISKKKIDIQEVINSSNINLKKEVINNRYEYGIDMHDICDIICSINDDSYKKEIIDNYTDYCLSSYQIVSIVASMKNDNIKDIVIKNRGKYNLSSYNILSITKSMNYLAIKKILNNNNDYPLTTSDLANIVRDMSDDKLKKEILESNNKFKSENIANIVASIKDDDYKKFYVNKFVKHDIDSFSTSIIIQSVKDDNYKYEVIKNYKDYKLAVDDILFILESIEDEKYYYQIIKNYQKYNFTLSDLVEVICLTKDDTYKAGIVYQNSYNFNPTQLTKIINSITIKEVKTGLLSILSDKGVYNKLNIEKTLAIPDNMTFGMEIEAEGSNNRVLKTDILPQGWKVKSDPTLTHGVEAISPILKNGSEQEIGKVCGIMQSLGLEATRSCAGHVHIGTSFFENDVNGFKNLLEIFSNVERVLYLISNEEGDIPREYVFKYALPITMKMDRVVNGGAVDFNDLTNLDRFSRMIKLIQKSKFSSINFNNIGIPHKDTIEFRISNGTINPNVWIDNINLFGNLMWISKIISRIQKKPLNSITIDEKKVLYYYESLKDKKVSDREKLKSLLLMIPTLDKKVYLNRYDVNSELYKEFTQDKILKEISRLKPIRISECSDELKEIIDNNYKQIANNDINNKKPKI